MVQRKRRSNRYCFQVIGCAALFWNPAAESTYTSISGMEPLIRAVLSNLIGEEDSKTIEIIANDVKIESDLSWNIQFRHPTRYTTSWCWVEVLNTEYSLKVFFNAAATVTTSPRPFCHTESFLIDPRFSFWAMVYQV